VLVFYIFLVFSRLLDVSPIWFLHIPLITLVLLVAMTLARGDLKHGFSTRLSWYFAALTAWVVVCFPFSVWRSASIGPVTGSIQSLGMFWIILQLVRTPDDWRRVGSAYAYSVLAGALLSFFVGRDIEGRIALVNGTLADPNEFALILAIGLPFWWFKASRAGALGKALCWLCTVPILVSFARTGSRSGLITLGVLFVVMIIFANVTQKVMIVAVAALGILAASALLPSYLKARFTSIFTPHDVQQLDDKSREQLNADLSSSEGREMLLKQSIQMTFEHPIFGVGPGVFAQASWDERKTEGQRPGLAQVSHNTYTQISSEIGIPGFIFLVATLFLCFKYTLADYRAARRVHSDLANFGLYMIASLSALAVGIFFLSVAYTYVLAVVFALAAALHQIVQKSLGQPATANPSPSPIAAPQSVAKSAPVIRPRSRTLETPVPTPSRSSRRGGFRHRHSGARNEH
jgi:O-antigen ligase